MPTADELGVSEVELTIPACATPSPLRIDTLASGLEVPWDVAFLSDGRALVTERPGRIRLLTLEGVLAEEPWAQLTVYGPPGSEVGLLGIDVREMSDNSAAVFVTATVQDLGENAWVRRARGIGRRLSRLTDPERGQATTLQIMRIADEGTRGGEPQLIVSGLPSGYLHGGGGLRIGPDGLIYTANGDGTEPARAQLTESLRGKIFRYELNGSVPSTNPWLDSPVYSLGIRHVQGMAWLPDGELLAIDHGPTGMLAENARTDRDELNVVTPGANLGWPIVTGATEGGGLTSPIVVWSPAIAPAGLSVYGGDSPAWSASVFVTALRGTSLRRIQLEQSASGVTAVCEEVLLASTYGRLRLNRMAPDGTLWIGTSNRDGRGLPRPGDDLILRLHPPE